MSRPSRDAADAPSADAAAADPPYLPIEDYAAIGNRHSVALVSSRGGIDWWCPDRFDGPSVFGALLDPLQGGRFCVRPADDFSVERKYISATNVLVTSFTTGSGVLRLVDALPLAAQERRGDVEMHLHDGIIRLLECRRGEVEVEGVFEPRWEYGRAEADLEDRGGMGVVTDHRGRALALRSDLPLRVVAGGTRAVGAERLAEGDRRHLSVSFTHGEPLRLPPSGQGGRKIVSRTAREWRAWARESEYEGPYRDAVIRSALALKLLTFAPSGALVAAPTTSLPERIGGSRNWDYRFCWLRDATMTVRVMLELGHRAEAQAFLNWLLHATHLTQPELRVAYDVYGRNRIPERELEHLAGYRDSSPVRVGNSARSQLQLDVYGEVIGAARQFVEREARLRDAHARTLRNLGETICERWREPDHGIWEIRSDRRHHTLSKVQCWLGLNDLLELHDAGRLDVPDRRFRSERSAIRDAVESHGWDAERESYVSWFGADVVDAGLLLLGLRGYVDPAAPRMRSTYDRIREELVENGLLHRYGPDYDDGMDSNEAAFGICSFWAAEYLAACGDRDRAREVFEHVLSCGNDLGLFAEEIDPGSGAARGNFPQAFTHLGLISAALALCRTRNDGSGRESETTPSSRDGTEA